MSNYKQLYIFVEGVDDERYINSVIKPNCTLKYNYVKIIRYANRVPSEIGKIISTIKNQASSEYIFLCDMDARGDTSLCITNRKAKENSKFSNVLDIGKILVVKEEIESWYLSGITVSNLTKYKIPIYPDTENVTKEEFVRLIPKRYASVTDFMIEVLKDYSLTDGIAKNNSLNYFMNKHIL